jgi:hypothetical protein
MVLAVMLVIALAAPSLALAQAQPEAPAAAQAATRGGGEADIKLPDLGQCQSAATTAGCC